MQMRLRSPLLQCWQIYYPRIMRGSTAGMSGPVRAVARPEHHLEASVCVPATQWPGRLRLLLLGKRHEVIFPRPPRERGVPSLHLPPHPVQHHPEGHQHLPSRAFHVQTRRLLFPPAARLAAAQPGWERRELKGATRAHDFMCRRGAFSFLQLPGCRFGV